MLVVLSLFLGTGPARSQDLDVAGIRVPEHAILAGENLVLNGAGLRRLYGLRVYVAALYLPEFHRQAEAVLERDMPRQMQLTLLRDVTTEQNLDALKGGLVANNSPGEMRAINPQVTRFLDLLHQVDHVPAGTVIQLDYQPRVGTHLSVGGQSLGTIPGEDFNRALLKIWLGEAPIQLSLKKALLGQEK